MTKLLAGVAIAAALAIPQITRAQDVVDGPNTGALTLSGGVDVVSNYIFRGYELEDGGLIVQPYAQLDVAAYQSEDFSITPYIGIWNSLQRQGDGDSVWWESDVYGGVDFTSGPFTLGVIYTFYTAPGDAFETIEEFGLKLSYDDSQFAEDIGLPFALNPYVAWYKETSDKGGPNDQYAEVGIVPAFALTDTPWSFSFPIAVGLSPDGYFLDEDGSNESIGYASAGAYATYALPWGNRYGSWALYGGATYYYLNADSVRTAGGENRTSEISAKVGLTFTY